MVVKELCLDIDDLNTIRHYRQQSLKEVAFVCDQEQIQIIQGEESSTDIPSDMINDDTFIGHSHPYHAQYMYMPPSAQDFKATSQHINKDWFVVDEHGIWIYRTTSQSISPAIIDMIDLFSCALMLAEIDIETYIGQLNSLPHTKVSFHTYQSIDQLCLLMTQKKKPL